jgi:hypothetical protein
VLAELGAVEQRYRAVLEVLEEGVSVRGGPALGWRGRRSIRGCRYAEQGWVAWQTGHRGGGRITGGGNGRGRWTFGRWT